MCFLWQTDFSFKMQNSKSPSLKIPWDYFFLHWHLLKQFLLFLNISLAHHKVFKLIPGVQTDSYVELYTPLRKEKGSLRRPHTHWTSFLKGSPLFDNYSCHTTSEHFFACSWIQLTSHVPSNTQESSQSIALGNISRYLAMVSNMQTQLCFLPCYHWADLSQFWPPLFHWLGTGWLSERGVWMEGGG